MIVVRYKLLSNDYRNDNAATVMPILATACAEVGAWAERMGTTVEFTGIDWFTIDIVFESEEMATLFRLAFISKVIDEKSCILS